MTKKNLTENDIQIILGMWSHGQDVKEIAEAFDEQENTIRYHLKKSGIDVNDVPYKILGKGYLDFLDEEDYKIRKKQKNCKHPSLRCSLCKLFVNNMQTDQYAEIISLQNRIGYLEEILKKRKIEF